jgi:hypothetical protein
LHFPLMWAVQPRVPCPLASPDQTTDSLPPPLACLPQPVCLDARAYWRATLPIVLLICLCLAQAFGYRLRRVIVAFYFPKVHPPPAPLLYP